MAAVSRTIPIARSAWLAGGGPEAGELAAGPVVQEALGIVGRAAEMCAGRPVRPCAEYLGQGRGRAADAHTQELARGFLACQQGVFGSVKLKSRHDVLPSISTDCRLKSGDSRVLRLANFRTVEVAVGQAVSRHFRTFQWGRKTGPGSRGCEFWAPLAEVSPG